MCESDIPIVANVNSRCEQLFVNTLNFFLGRNLKQLSKCLPPCFTMNLKLKRTSHNANSKGYARLSYVTNEEVVVFKETYSYDITNLVVDTGSALGLWLGLSVLSILDHTITLFNLIEKKKFFH